MKWNQGIRMATWLMLISIFLAACGGDQETEQPALVNETTTETTTSTSDQQKEDTESADSESQTRTVSTINGDVEIPANPSRIALTYHDDIDHLMELGIRPAGVPTYERTGQTNGYPPYLADQMEGIEKLGNMPTPETILSVEPDLIIAGYPQQEIYDQLQKIAPTLYLEWKMDWRETHLELGKALGLEEKAQANIDSYNEKLEDARQQLSTLADETVAYVRLMPKEIRIHGVKDQVPGYLLYEQLGLLPATGVPTDEWAKVISNEQFALLDADHIFLHADEDQETEKLVKELLENPAYKDIPALKNGNVHLVPNHPWNRGGPVAFREGIDQVLEAMLP